MDVDDLMIPSPVQCRLPLTRPTLGTADDEAQRDRFAASYTE